ncbi:MAG: phosphatase, partial [Synergistaceae bacterium]|nr:phosphatase [Synergistaceae bacterium]
SGHAFSTVQELAAAAAEKGLEMIAVTDHGPAREGAPILMYFSAMMMLPETISGVKILRGVEANIIDYDGNLDLPESSLSRLDFVMAGFHDVVLPPCGDIGINTRAMQNAIANPFVDAISHPGNPVFQIDIPTVVNTAREHGKLLEINDNSISVRAGSQENCRQIAEACKEAQHPVTCGSDAHVSFHVGAFSNCIRILESINFPEELVLNTSAAKLTEFLGRIRKRGCVSPKR